MIFTTWGGSPQVVPKIVFTHVRSRFVCMSHLHFFYTRCIGEITSLSNRPAPSRKVGVATAKKMAACKRDKVLSFLASKDDV